MLKQLRVLLICVLVFGVLLTAACGKTSKGGLPENSSAGEEPTSAATEPISVGQTTEPSAEPATEPAARELTADIANRYLGIVARLYDQYGVGTINERGNFMRGVSFVKLLDLDGDGVEEMICAYENPERGEYFPYVNEYAVYGPDSAEPLFAPRPVSNYGNGDAPGMGFLTKDGKVYVEKYNCGYEISYYHLEGGSPVTDISFKETEDFENGTVTAWLNGEERDPETAFASLEGFEATGVKEQVLFYDYDEADALQKVRSDTDLTLNRLETLGSAGF